MGAFLKTAALLGIFVPLISQAQEAKPAALPLTPDDFIKRYLELDEEFQQSGWQKKNAEADLGKARDYFQNTLTLQPTHSKSENSTEGNVIPYVEQSRDSIGGSMTQTLPTGSILGAEGTYYFDDVNPRLPGLNSEYRLYFEQSLWRNSFGSLFRRRVDAAEARVEQFDWGEDRVMLDSCIASVELYLNTYLTQEQSRIAQQVYQDAQKAKKITEQGYDQRVVRKIDYLNSRSDYLRVQTEALQAQTSWEQRMNTFKIKIAAGDASAFELKEPDAFFSRIQFNPNLNIAESVHAREAVARMNADHANYRAVSNESRPQVNLGVSVARRTSVIAAGAFLADIQSDQMDIYLKLELPLINRTRRGNIDSAFAQYKISEIERSQVERQLRDDFQKLLLNEKQFTEQIKLSKENQNIKGQQLNEAQKLLRIGRIEFEEYVRYRDSFFDEKVNELQLKTNLWQTRTRLGQYDSSLFQVCRKTL